MLEWFGNYINQNNLSRTNQDDPGGDPYTDRKILMSSFERILWFVLLRSEELIEFLEIFVRFEIFLVGRIQDGLTIRCCG